MTQRIRIQPIAFRRLMGWLATIFLASTSVFHAQTKNGIDVLVESGFALLKGRRVGLITNHTGMARDERATIDLMASAPEVKLVALFSPEHGIRGVAEEKVQSAVDAKTGLPIYSLYSDTRRPTDEMLKGIDTLVFDIQDIGTRFYTYITTLGYGLEEAAKRSIKFVVLDRPNPVGGIHVQGPMLDADQTSFVAYLPMPVRHGMTVGELAQFYKKEKKLDVDLEVVTMKQWNRRWWFDATELPWVNPSPNMRNLNEATLYPGIGLLEGTNLSVGRGTDTPFERLGAPWIDGLILARELRRANLPGVQFVPGRFTPRASKFANELCGGVFFVITDRERLDPTRLGLTIARILWKLYPETFEIDRMKGLLGNQRVLDELKSNVPLKKIFQQIDAEVKAFKKRRAAALIYP